MERKRRLETGPIGGDLAVSHQLMETPIRQLTPDMLRRAALQCTAHSLDVVDAKDMLDICGLYKGTEGSLEESFSTSSRSIGAGHGDEPVSAVS